MGKRLRIRDRLLLGVALASDYILPALIRAGRGLPPQDLPDWLPEKYKSNNFRSLISRLYKTGCIERVIKNGQPYLRLANEGKTIINRDFSYITLQNKKWDGYWRMVIFDFPEKDRSLRDQLRDKLVGLGFGQLQKSIYISPHNYNQDLVEYLSIQHFLGKAYVLTAKHEFMGNPKDLADLVWHLDDLNEKYEDILDRIGERRLGDAKTRKEIINSYLEILQQDPFLPKELLPIDWIGEKLNLKMKKCHI